MPSPAHGPDSCHLLSHSVTLLIRYIRMCAVGKKGGEQQSRVQHLHKQKDTGVCVVMCVYMSMYVSVYF